VLHAVAGEDVNVAVLEAHRDLHLHLAVVRVEEADEVLR
jgi:hypothetical protein